MFLQLGRKSRNTGDLIERIDEGAQASYVVDASIEYEAALVAWIML